MKKHEIFSDILQLKKELADTDYLAIKHSEGLISDDDYAGIKVKRQSLRERINELEDAFEKAEE